MNKEPKIGDLVWLDGYTTIAQQIFGQYPIEKIEERFDNFTGEKFLILLVNGDWYDERDGACYSNINSMYFIDAVHFRDMGIDVTQLNKNKTIESYE